MSKIKIKPSELSEITLQTLHESRVYAYFVMSANKNCGNYINSFNYNSGVTSANATTFSVYVYIAVHPHDTIKTNQTVLEGLSTGGSWATLCQ